MLLNRTQVSSLARLLLLLNQLIHLRLQLRTALKCGDGGVLVGQLL